MSADGVAERSATVAKLQAALAPAKVYRGIPDDALLDRNAMGAVLPYCVIKFAGPVPTRRDRRIAVGEEKQPVIMAVLVTAYAVSQEDADDLAADIVNALLGWAPDPDNATPYAAAGGYAFGTMSPTNKPSRFEEGISFQTTLNMAA